MNFESWIASKVLNGKEATISLALLEAKMYEPAIKGWIDATAKKFDCKSTIHWKSNVVTFYPRGQA
jgi:hypothetical protein